MRYLLILEEYQYNDFQKVDGNPLEIYARDKTGIKRIFEVKPIQRNMLILRNGNSLYLEPRHVDALLALDHRISLAEGINHMMENLAGDVPYDVDNMTYKELEKAFPDINAPRYDGDRDIVLRSYDDFLTPDEVKKELGIVSPSEHAPKQYAVNPEELRKAINGEEDKDNGHVD